MHNINLTEDRNDLIQFHTRITSCRAFSFISFPTTASFVPSRIEAPPPSLSSPFPLHSSSLFSPSFFIRCPDKTFLTRDISCYEWGATGTIFPSSCYPVSFFAVARPRDLSFAAARFYITVSLLLSFSLSFLLLGFRAVSLQPARTVASFVQGKALPRSAFEVDVSSGHIFVTNPRAARPESPSEAVQVNLREYLSTIVRVDVSAPI